MMLKRMTALFLSLLTATLAAGCAAPAVKAPSSPAAVTVTDMSGRTIIIDKPIERIVVLTASDCEIIYALGAGGLVVGRGEYCDYPEEVLNITEVKSGSDTNIEQVIALKPDVVIMSQMAQTPEHAASFEAAGIAVVQTHAQKIEDIYTAITIIGQVLGKSDEAKAVIDDMKKTFDALKAKIPKDSDRSIYFEVSPLQYGLYTAGTGTFMDEIAAMLGLKNIFGDLQSWAQISEEQVIQRNPDYIVTTTMSQKGAPDPVEEILSRKGWEDITAIRNKTIYNADTNSSALMHPGPRLADAAQELYHFVYGN